MWLFAGPAASRNYVAEGDSITSDFTAAGQGYADAISKLANPKVTSFNNKAVSGSALSTMQARAAAVDALYIPGAQNILSVFIGANSLSTPGEAAATFLPGLASYLDARRTTGWYVLLCTILPHGNGTTSTFYTERAIANPELRLWVTNGSIVPGKHADRIIDFAADSLMGPDAGSANTTYFTGDQIHPTTAGQARMRDIAWPVFDASLSGVRLNPVIRAVNYTTEVGSTDLTLNLRADRGVTWSISGGNAGGALNMNELYQLKLSASTLGTYTTTITAVDGNGLSSSQAFTWNVPNPPVGYGPNLLINGNAINDYLGWTGSALNLWFGVDLGPTFSTVDIGSGQREFRILGDGINSNPQAGQNLTTISGKTYKVDWTARVGTATPARFQIQTVNNFDTVSSTNTANTQSPVINVTLEPFIMLIPGATPGDVFFSNIAVRQLLP